MTRIPKKTKSPAPSIALAAQAAGIAAFWLDLAISVLITVLNTGLANTTVAKNLRKAALKIFRLLLRVYAGDPDFVCNGDA